MMRVTRSSVLCLLLLVLAPAVALAQASIAGTVHDSSGASLPGVTVEASSPALIEKVRTAVSDGSGVYRIVNLPPGTYAVSFTLPGFNVIRREGIELSGSFTAQIDSNLTVGGVAETITVSGETPIVDVQSIRRQTTISSEVLTSIPTARSWAATALLIPGIITTGGGPTDVQVTPQMTVFGGAGGRNNEGRMQVDGLNTGAGLGGSYTDELEAKGLTTPGALLKQWDFTYGMGGPNMKDRLWYRFAIRDEGQHRTIPNIYPNLNAGDASKYSYAPDLAHEVRGAESWRLYTVRITAQATRKDKINVHWDEQHPCNGATYDVTGDGCRNPPKSG